MSNNPNSDFKITCTVNKAYEYHDLTSRETKKRIQGMASGIGVDREGERMSRSVIDSFRKTIKEGIYLDSGDWSYVPLVSEHRKNGLGEPQWDQILGHIVDAWVDGEWNLWIEAELDTFNPSSTMLFEKLTRDPEEGKPKNLGLSIGGIVVDAGMEWDDELARSLHTYRDVALREVTVTSAPAYPTRYLTALAKSVDWEKVENTKESVPMKVEFDLNNDAENQEDEVVKAEDVQTEDQIIERSSEEEVVAEEPQIEKEVEVAADQDAVAEQDVEKEQADAEVAEAVEKSEEQVEEAAEVSFVTTDAFEALSSTVNDMASKLASFTEQFEKSISQGLLFKPEFDEEGEPVNENTDEAAAEAEQGIAEGDEQEVVVGDVVEPSGDDAEEVIEDENPETAPVERSVDLAALLEGLNQLNEKISSLDKSFSAKIEELSNEEVDKSIVPSRANAQTNKMLEDNEESDFMQNINSKRGFAAINAAFE